MVLALYKQEAIAMRTKHILSLLVGILYFGLLSPIAFATPEEDMASAEKSFNEEDIKEAARFLRLAAEQNYFPAQIRLGEFMNASDDHDEAFGWFLTAAFQGDAAGQYNLGQMYALGYGTQQNFEKALYWTKKAAEQNFLPAVQLLAMSYKVIPETDNKKSKVKNFLGVIPNQVQADFWAAKLPELEKAEIRRIKKFEAAAAKKAAEAAAAAKAKK